MIRSEYYFFDICNTPTKDISKRENLASDFFCHPKNMTKNKDILGEKELPPI